MKHLQFFALLKGSQFQHSGNEQIWKTFLCFYLEPIGSSPPKLNTKKINVITEDLGTQLALTCPAQGMPIPSYR